MDDIIRDAQWLLHEKYKGVASTEYEKDLEYLKKGVPLAYLIGWVPFLSSRIFLSSHPLIPRPETEYWTKQAIEEMKTARGPLKILDLCAGSGCIGVSVLKEIPDATVDFAEINKTHHSTISKNSTDNDIDPVRTHIFGGDLFEEVEGSYDYILCNPPYIDRAANTVDENVAEHEPHEALFGGVEGFEIIKRILTEAPSRLKKDAVLYIEHEPAQVSLIRAIARELPYNSVESQKDQYGVLRYTRLTRD